MYSEKISAGAAEPQRDRPIPILHGSVRSCSVVYQAPRLLRTGTPTAEHCRPSLKLDEQIVFRTPPRPACGERISRICRSRYVASNGPAAAAQGAAYQSFNSSAVCDIIGLPSCPEPVHARQLADLCAIVLMVALRPLGIRAQPARARHARRGGDQRDRRRDHRAPVPVALGLLSADLRDRPLAARLPAPNPRRPGELADSAAAYAYTRALAAASPGSVCSPSAAPRKGAISCSCDRRRERHPGPGSPESGDRRARGSAQDRSGGRGTKIIQDARPIYYFNAALHSDETGSTETMLELAYRLAVPSSP